jgi:hypothetical protein
MLYYIINVSLKLLKKDTIFYALFNIVHINLIIMQHELIHRLIDAFFAEREIAHKISRENLSAFWI